MVVDEDFVFQKAIKHIPNGSFSNTAPSNIALVKYWGKKEGQLPANPSISFTLTHCKTITKMDFKEIAIQENGIQNFSFDFLLDGQAQENFRPKIEDFFKRIEKYCPYLKHYHITIATHNTFPHSSGIASSASGMAAIALNIMLLEKNLNPMITDEFMHNKASFLARLGSGSACRSIKGSVVLWGKHADFEKSSDLFGITFPTKIHAVFANYQDTILLVDKGQKQVSSSVGHNLMHNHPFAANRFNQAHENLSKIKTILETGNLNDFISLVEHEALTLHSMMMTSTPYFILMKPNTLNIINAIWEFRNQTQIPVCFTLDAGANVHLLYPEKHKKSVLDFINQKLVGYCEKGLYICDEISIT